MVLIRVVHQLQLPGGHATPGRSYQQQQEKPHPGEFEVLEPAQQGAAAGKDGKTGNHGEAGAPGKESAAPAGGHDAAHPAAPLGLHEISAGVIDHGKADQPRHAVFRPDERYQSHSEHGCRLQRHARDDGVAPIQVGAQPYRQELEGGACQLRECREQPHLRHTGSQVDGKGPQVVVADASHRRAGDGLPAGDGQRLPQPGIPAICFSLFHTQSAVAFIKGMIMPYSGGP